MAAGVGATGGSYGVYGGGGSDLDALTQAQRVASYTFSQPLERFFVTGAGSSRVSFEEVCAGKRTERLFLRRFDWDENGDDEFDDYFQQPEKKRRLTGEQVWFLEKSFEAESKLEPERKVQLAKELGLRPRQVAIWFQNRRARWKNKQLEKDFETLQASFNSLNADYDNLLKEKEKLKAEVLYLSGKLHLKEKKPAGDVETSDSANQFQTCSQEPVLVDPASEDEPPGQQQVSVILFSPKLEDLTSGLPPPIDGLDVESPLPYVDYCHLIMGGLLCDPAANSTYASEPDCSDVSQDKDKLNGSQENLLPCSSHDVFATMDDVDYGDHDASANISGFGIPFGEEDYSPWIWSY